MNLKNILFCAFMMSMPFTSNVTLAGVAASMFDGLDKVVIAALSGTLGVGIGGTYGVMKKGLLGALLGIVVGGSSGAVIGLTGLVMVKAICKEIKNNNNF